MTNEQKIKIICNCLANELLNRNKNLTKRQYFYILDCLTVLNDILKENKYKTVEYNCSKIGLKTEE